MTFTRMYSRDLIRVLFTVRSNDILNKFLPLFGENFIFQVFLVVPVYVGVLYPIKTELLNIADV